MNSCMILYNCMYNPAKFKYIRTSVAQVIASCNGELLHFMCHKFIVFGIIILIREYVFINKNKLTKRYGIY